MSITMTRHAFACAALLVALSAAGSSSAQHAHSHAAPNGGQIQKIGTYEGELVVKGAEVTLFIVDEAEKKVDAASMAASAVVLAKGNQSKTVEMKPAGENRLVGAVDFPVEGKFRATVTLRTAGGEAGKARYSLDAK